MDIGTAKPTVIERRGVPHHMIDIVDPEEDFSVAEFRHQVRGIFHTQPDQPFLITGGSGLHFRAVVDPMSFAPTDPVVRAGFDQRELPELASLLVGADPDAATHVDMNNKRRVVRALEILELTNETPSQRAGSADAEAVRRYESEIPFVAVGLDPEADVERRIGKRLDMMRSGGLVQEVEGLLGRLGRTARAAVGYRELTDALEAGSSIDEAFELARNNTRKLARRQRTWFQRDPRIRWIPWLDGVDERTERVLEVLSESD
jgi:tRNA dimethylallyltransferase